MQDVGCETAISGACFDEIERRDRRTALAGGEDVCHLGDLSREQLTKDRSDIDAGKKIARAAGSLGRAGIVAQLGMIERQIHERGHREWPAFVNELRDCRDVSSRHSTIAGVPAPTLS